MIKWGFVTFIMFLSLLGGTTRAEIDNQETSENTATFRFVLTSGFHQETEDLDSVVKAEFGPNATVADWETIKNLHSHDIASFANSAGLVQNGDRAWAYRNGQAFWSEQPSLNRHYFVERHEHVVPFNWLVHDHIDNHFLDLGSWYGLSMPVLVDLGLSSPGAQNVALQSAGAVATATTAGCYEGCRYASYSNDGDESTFWAGTRYSGDWLIIELAQTYSVNTIILKVWYNVLTYTIDASTNGVNWHTVVSHTTSTNPQEGDVAMRHELRSVLAKYFRLNILNSSALGSHIFKSDIKEFEIYSDTTTEVSPPVGVLPEGYTGQVKVTCINDSTSETISFSGNGTRLQDCKANGLFVSERDRVTVVVSGRASSFADHRYDILWNCGNWSACKSEAEFKGGHLAFIDSAEEQKFVYSSFKSLQQFWIGLSDSRREGIWRLSDGSFPTYAHWQTGHPQNATGQEDCAAVMTAAAGRWNSVACSESHHAVVEFE